MYEQGSRIIQFVRFPPLFGKEQHVLDDFITSNVDIASVIFEITGTSLDNGYDLDGTSWINDVRERIYGASSEPECCQQRNIDVFNSHAIVTKNWKYIFRATPIMESDGEPANLYKYALDEQQLYNLNWDSGEQWNQINNQSLSQIIAKMQKDMITYIQDEMCPAINTTNCKIPDITFTLSPTPQPTGDGDTMEPTASVTNDDGTSGTDTIKETETASGGAAGGKDGGGISGGGIAAIVIVLLLIFGCGLLCFWMSKSGKLQEYKIRLEIMRETNRRENSRRASYNRKDPSQSNMVSISNQKSIDKIKFTHKVGNTSMDFNGNNHLEMMTGKNAQGIDRFDAANGYDMGNNPNMVGSNSTQIQNETVITPEPEAFDDGAPPTLPPPAPSTDANGLRYDQMEITNENKETPESTNNDNVDHYDNNNDNNQHQDNQNYYDEDPEIDI